MKLILPILSSLFLLNTLEGYAQKETPDNATTYNVEMSGTSSVGDQAPFWITNNKYGLFPIDSNNGYLRAGVFHNQSMGSRFRWEAGMDVALVVPRYKNVYIHQLYADLNYRSLRLSIGSKEKYTSLWDRHLSSGDMVFSSNARPIPEINLSIPDFAVIPGSKGWLQVKGDFAVGKSLNKSYLEDFANSRQTYIYNALTHHKSFYLRTRDTKGKFPLFATIGVQHWANWGGTSTNPKLGEQPHSLKDFFRVVAGKSGGEDATASAQVNVLGDHFGSYDIQIGYNCRNQWEAFLYHQHIFNDKSGMIWNNKADGLWGLDLRIASFSWLSHLVVEYVTTMDQTGPFHYINYDHDKYHAMGGGADNYYNNEEYTTGASYFGMALGSPLLTSPAYNRNGKVSFTNNRLKAWHLAFEGEASTCLSYRFQYTHTSGFGTPYIPFTEIRRNHSAQLALHYSHPKLKGWNFEGAVAGDHGRLYGKNLGFNITISKTGLLKKW